MVEFVSSICSTTLQRARSILCGGAQFVVACVGHLFGHPPRARGGFSRHLRRSGIWQGRPPREFDFPAMAPHQPNARRRSAQRGARSARLRRPLVCLGGQPLWKRSDQRSKESLARENMNGEVHSVVGPKLTPDTPNRAPNAARRDGRPDPTPPTPPRRLRTTGKVGAMTHVRLDTQHPAPVVPNPRNAGDRGGPPCSGGHGARVQDPPRGGCVSPPAGKSAAR